MAKIIVKRGFGIPGSDKDLLPGPHTQEIEDRHLTHWGIKGMIASGDVVIIPEPIPVIETPNIEEAPDPPKIEEIKTENEEEVNESTEPVIIKKRGRPSK